MAGILYIDNFWILTSLLLLFTIIINKITRKNLIIFDKEGEFKVPCGKSLAEIRKSIYVSPLILKILL